MRVAVLLSGQWRTGEQCFPSIYDNILGPLAADIFMHAWSDLPLEKMQSLYQPKRMLVEPCSGRWQEEAAFYEKFKPPETKPLSVLSMYRGWTRVAALFAQYEQEEGIVYDFVVRLRYDLAVASPLAPSAIRIGTLVVPQGQDYRGGLNDQVVWGAPAAMAVYCALYQHVASLVLSGVAFHPETLLRQHLQRRGIAVLRVPFAYSINR